MAGQRVLKLVLPSFLAIAGLMVSFQNCSESLPADADESADNSSLSTPSPTPAPLFGQYYPNPAVVGSVITIMPIGGTGTYTFPKTSGAGTLAGSTYQAPAAPENAIITITDSSGRSYPLQIQIYASAPSPTPTPAATPTPTPSPTPGANGVYTICGGMDKVGAYCASPNPRTRSCSCPSGSSAFVVSTSESCPAGTLWTSSTVYGCN